MPSLAELTDAYPQQDNSLPVAQPDIAEQYASALKMTKDEFLNKYDVSDQGVKLKPVADPAVVQPQSTATVQAPIVSGAEGTDVPDTSPHPLIDKLFGLNGQERYQTWPERMVREPLEFIKHGLAGEIPSFVNQPVNREDYTDIPYEPKEEDKTWLAKKLGLNPVVPAPGDRMVEGALSAAALAGTGGIAGADASLGSAPFLRPALKYEGKIYKAPMDGQHLDALPAHLAEDFQTKAMSGDDISHYQFGFMNHKGQFLDREKALDYGIQEGLIDPHAGKYGALTSTMLSDSSKPGIAIEALKQPTFYSALEHNVNNISQTKMTGNQWLGTLGNKPGVKPEELQWTGLQDFLKENGNKPVTKEQVVEHLQNNKIDIKNVDKEAALTKREADRIKELQTKEIKGERLTDDELGEYQDLVDKQHNEINPTKYHGYQLAGGENYREKLLTLPSTLNRYDAFIDKMTNKYGDKPLAYMPMTEAEKAHIDNLIEAYGDKGNDYKSSHWDEPNILAHIRMNDRMINGKKSLHLEEIQSDLHQTGRDKGYRDEKSIKAYDDYEKDLFKRTKDSFINDAVKGGVTRDRAETMYKTLLGDKPSWEQSRYLGEAEKIKHKEIWDAAQTAKEGVPDFPFKKTWHELALKRMIREAAEKGYDRLSWTPGEAQAARYDLSKSVEDIHYDENGLLTAYDKSGRKVIEKTVEDKELPNIIGKEAADKLIKAKPNEEGTRLLNNTDLKIGGEGMKGFYDQIIPKSVEKLTGEKVKSTEINPKTFSIKEERLPTGNIVYDAMEGDSLLSSFRTREAAQQNINENMAKSKTKIHYIDLPQALKDRVLQKGQPLFSGNYMFTPVDHDPFESKK